MFRQSAGARRSNERASRGPPRALGALLLVLLAASLPACGIKGPLRPPPKSAPAGTTPPPSTDNPAAPPPSTSPALPPPSSPPGNP